MHLTRKVLAVDTGGRVMEPTDDPAANTNDYSLTGFKVNSDLVQQINSCVQEAGTYYTLSFDPSHANHPDEYHDLKVRINRPGLTARTTTGYYDEPYYSDQPNPAARPVTVEQLEQVLSAAHGKPDAEVARQLWDLTLTERLSSTRLLECLAGQRGGKARHALVAMADASTFLNPPAGEVSADAPPDHNAQQRMTSLALEYLNKALPNLPNFYATRTTVHYQETPPFEKGDAKITYQPLHIADTVKDTVLYRDGDEVLEPDTGKHKQRKADEPYLVTWGTFGPLLRGAIDTIFVAPDGLSWRRWEKGAGKSLAVFGYAIPEGREIFLSHRRLLLAGQRRNNRFPPPCGLSRGDRDRSCDGSHPSAGTDLRPKIDYAGYPVSGHDRIWPRGDRREILHLPGEKLIRFERALGGSSI